VRSLPGTELNTQRFKKPANHFTIIFAFSAIGTKAGVPTGKTGGVEQTGPTVAASRRGDVQAGAGGHGRARCRQNGREDQ
jgi:hypothetical protein